MRAPVRLVLLRPRNPDNVGAVARAMKNFGVTEWALVAPGFDDLRLSEKMAVHATDLLRGARVVQTLDEAVGDCVWVVGTSSRSVPGKRRMGPAPFAREAWERGASGPVALVFGDERSGMSNEDVDRCHDLSAIAAEDAQPSLNLAQAALLYCYQLHEAGRAAAPPPAAPTGQLATDAELTGVEEALGRLLLGAGFLRTAERHAVRDLMSSLRRGVPLRREIRLWRAALESAAKALRR